jgi:large subunit ribosomal protein L23
MTQSPYHIVRGPVLTEESTIQTETRNKYIFKVSPKANKKQIRDAVEKLFNVKVTGINTMNYQGKQGRGGQRGVPGRRPNWKKAVVTLQAGDSIDLI